MTEAHQTTIDLPTKPARAVPEPTSAPRRSRRHGRKFWLRATMLLFLVPFLFAVIASVSVLGQRITAPSWITERVEAEAAGFLNGGSIEFGNITMTIGDDLHPEISLTNAVLRDANGVTLAKVPQIEALVSPRGLLFRREILVQKVTLAGAQIALRRASTGSVAVAFDSASGAVRQAEDFGSLLEELDRVLERPALQALETVSARGLIVNFEDARAGRSWTVDGGAMDLDLRGGKTRVDATLALLTGRSYVTDLGLHYESLRGNRASRFSLNATNAVAADLATQSAALSWLSIIDAPITAELQGSIDDGGTLGPLRATLDIGQGAIRPTSETRPIPFRSAKATTSYDPKTQELTFARLDVDSPWAAFTGSGHSYMQDVVNGLPQVILGQFAFADISFNPANLYPEQRFLDAAQVDFRMNMSPFSIEIGQVFADLGRAEVTAKGSVIATPTGWDVAMDASVPVIAAERVLSFWPESLKPRTRHWFETNVLSGDLQNLTGGIRLAPDAKPIWAANFDFSDATVRYMKSLPPVEGGGGFASFQENGFTLSLDEGGVTAPRGGRVDLAGSTFGIPYLLTKQPPATVGIQADSTITAALAILDLPPFEYLTKAGMPVTLADGRAVTRADINLPLRTGLTPDEVAFEAVATLTSLRSRNLVPDRTVAATELTLAADRSGLRIDGPVLVGNVPMQIGYHRAFGPGSGDSQLDAEVELSERFLTEFRIGLPPGTVSGSGVGQLSLALRRDAAPSFALTSNLAGLTVALPAIGWTKPRDTQGDLLVEGTLGPVPEVRHLAINAAGLRAEGAISLRPGGGLERAKFERVRIGDWFEASVDLLGRGAGAPLGIEVRNGSIDLRYASFGDSGGKGGPMRLSLDRLQVSEGIALTDFEGDFNGSGGFSGQFEAQINASAPVRGTVVPQDGRSAVRLTGDNAGAVFRAIGFLKNANEGSFDMVLSPSGTEGNYDGTLAVTALRVKDAPVLAGLLDAISVFGLLQQLDGRGLSFDTVDARFRLTPTQVIVTQSSATGPGLGISMDGTYTIATKLVDFQGVVSPFYLVNRIGAILTRPGEGLIGFNYRIGGSTDALEVRVNPLSVFTPGMFREIFRAQPPSENPPSDDPPSE